MEILVEKRRKLLVLQIVSLIVLQVAVVVLLQHLTIRYFGLSVTFFSLLEGVLLLIVVLRYIKTQDNIVEHATKNVQA